MKVTQHLWFEKDMEAAIGFYTSLGCRLVGPMGLAAAVRMTRVVRRVAPGSRGLHAG